ncbi:MAG: hypothetical protein JXA99_11575 [Candidatus Lokiarchaeota archaeon]|nr:hypothetical protein [Candidatus Lokiarchaeota archaeon]
MLISIIKDNFYIYDGVDFPSFYYSGKYIYTNPELVYTSISPPYFYLPSFASIFSIISIFEYNTATWIYIFIILIFGILYLREFNKLLVIKGVSNKLNRFIFLIAISNGIILLQNFDFLQTKFITLFLIILFLRREIQYRKNIKDQFDTKFVFTQLFILTFAIGMFPQFAFIVLIYLFKDISNIKDIINRSQLKIYGLFIVILAVQNFIVFVFPNLLLDFLTKGIGFYNRVGNISDFTPSWILLQKSSFSVSLFPYFALIFSIEELWFTLISITIMMLITIYLISKYDIKIEEKFAYFFLATLFFSIFVVQTIIIILLPVILILFIYDFKKIDNYLNLKNYGNYIKTNIYFLIAALCISASFLMPTIDLVYRILPFTMDIPIQLLLPIPIFIYVILVIDLYLMIRKRRNKNK